MKGDELRRARIRAGLTQPALARKLGVGARTIRSWERGEHAPRHLEMLMEQLIEVKVLRRPEATATTDTSDMVNADLLRLAADHQREAARHAGACADLLRELADRIEPRNTERGRGAEPEPSRGVVASRGDGTA